MRLILTAACLTALVLADLAAGSRPPRAAERAAIIGATKRYIDTSDCCAVISRIKVRGIRVSTVDQRWAVIHIDGYDQSGRPVGPATAVLHRGYLTNRWRVRDFGTSHVGCEMPRRVRRDLRQGC
jgi:hypothetical protein